SPLLRADRALVAYRKRREDAARGGLTEDFLESVADPFSNSLDEIREISTDSEQHRLCSWPDIPGCSNATLEEPGFVVEAVRVEAAVRAAQPHTEAPALARMNRRGHDRGLAFALFVGRRAAVPGEQELLREPDVRRFRLELEAQAALPLRRQARDDP